jgi:Asp/Glu/hydantoin racemase
MARHRRPLEEALGIPVIDPTQAAAAMAFGAVQFAQA